MERQLRKPFFCLSYYNVLRKNGRNARRTLWLQHCHYTAKVKGEPPNPINVGLRGVEEFIMVQRIDEIIESFSLYDDWEDRYSLLIDLGKKLPDFPEDMKKDENLVRGCVSKVWMVPHIEKGIFTFQADSDAFIVKGLVGLLHIIYNGQPLPTLKSIDIDGIFEKLGLLQNLSPNRRNGVFSMIERIRNIT